MTAPQLMRSCLFYVLWNGKNQVRIISVHHFHANIQKRATPLFLNDVTGGNNISRDFLSLPKSPFLLESLYLQDCSV